MGGVPPPPPPHPHHDRLAASVVAPPAPPPMPMSMPLPQPQLLGRELSSPPSDGISNLRFSNYSDHLLVSSWDAKVRLYDASANVLKGQFAHRAPVLDCCFHDDSSGFTASADHTVYRSRLENPSLNPNSGTALMPRFSLPHLDLTRSDRVGLYELCRCRTSQPRCHNCH